MVWPLDATALADVAFAKRLPQRIRVWNCLQGAGYGSVGDVRNASDAELLRIRGFGVRSLSAVRALLGRPSLRSHTDPPEAREFLRRGKGRQT